MNNPQLLQQLKSSLLALQLKRTELLNKYDVHYRLVEDVDREIATAQRLIDDQANALIREDSSNVSNTPSSQDNLARKEQRSFPVCATSK